MRAQIFAFVRESNAIEGIRRKPTRAEISATEEFLAKSVIVISDVEVLVSIYQPDAVLRRRHGLNVRVGDHVAPYGGPEIEQRLSAILSRAGIEDPWELHIAYETLHPFTDGNGRSGRAIWAWQMMRKQGGLPLGFLHQFYYQTLSSSRRFPRPVQPEGEGG